MVVAIKILARNVAVACMSCLVSRAARIKDRVAARMRDVGSRLSAYALVVVFWAITAISLDNVYKSVSAAA